MSRLGMAIAWTGGILVCAVGVASSPLAFRDRVPEAPILASAAQSAAGDTVVESDTPIRDSAWLAAPFRPGRVAPTERYTPELAKAYEAAEGAAVAREAGAVAEAEVAAQRPPWILRGVLLGNPALAIFIGMPESTEGAVVAEGEVVGGFTVSDIQADSVVVRRDGEAWTFTVTTPWS